MKRFAFSLGMALALTAGPALASQHVEQAKPAKPGHQTTTHGTSSAAQIASIHRDIEAARADAVRARDALAKNDVKAARKYLDLVGANLEKAEKAQTNPKLGKEIAAILTEQRRTVAALNTPNAHRDSVLLVKSFQPAMQTLATMGGGGGGKPKGTGETKGTHPKR